MEGTVKMFLDIKADTVYVKDLYGAIVFYYVVNVDRLISRLTITSRGFARSQGWYILLFLKFPDKSLTLMPGIRAKAILNDQAPTKSSKRPISV